jgi:hypothetical protein
MLDLEAGIGGTREGGTWLAFLKGLAIKWKDVRHDFRREVMVGEWSSVGESGVRVEGRLK